MTYFKKIIGILLVGLTFYANLLFISCTPKIKRVVPTIPLVYESIKNSVSKSLDEASLNKAFIPQMGATLKAPQMMQTTQQTTLEVLHYVQKIDSLSDVVEVLQEQITDVQHYRAFTAKEILPISLDSMQRKINVELTKINTYRKDFNTPPEKLKDIEKNLRFVKKNLDKVGKGYKVSKGLNIKLIANVFFRSGEHITNQTNLKQLDHTIAEMLKSIDAYRKEVPQEKIILVVKVEGFADKKPFYTYQPLKERQEQNLKMSKMRSQAVADYIHHRLEPLIDEIEQNINGLGEALPPTLTEDSDLPNPRRRVCVINLFIYSTP